MSDSSHHKAPSLYDDDIVDLSRHSSHSSSHSSHSSGGAETSSHHHHHRHSTAGVRLQISANRFSQTDVLVKAIYRWVVQIIIIAVLAAFSLVLWKKNKRLSIDLLNREGTNAILRGEVEHLQAERDELLRRNQKLESDNAELDETIKALRIAAAAVLGGAAQ